MSEIMDNAVNAELQRKLNGGAGNLSPRTLLAIGYVQYVMEREHHLSNGATALYWHLVGVASGHVTGTREKPLRRKRALAAKEGGQ